MKKTIAILFLSFIYHGFLYAQSKECIDNIRTGTFEYETEGVTIKVVRTRTKQIESYNNGKSKVIMKIKWISDTEWIGIFVKEVNAPGCLKKGDEVKIVIIKCDSKSYTAYVVSEKCGEGEVTVLKVE